MTLNISIVDTGVANVASIIAAVERLGATPRLTSDPDEMTRATHVILPGVGSIGAGMERLRSLKIIEPLKARIAQGQSTLTICLGFQMLCMSSEESPDTPGLGILPARITRFEPPLHTPQLGWNTVSPERGNLIVTGDAYFANSYCLRTAPKGWNYATTTYGSPFISAIWRRQVLACQFHPELSGKWGQSLLKRWIAQIPNPVKESSPC